MWSVSDRVFLPVSVHTGSLQFNCEITVMYYEVGNNLSKRMNDIPS